jgi:heme A synthase
MKALKIVFGAVGALNLIFILMLKRVDSQGKIVMLGSLNSEYLWALTAFLLWSCLIVTAILMFREKDEKKKQRSTVIGAVCAMSGLVVTLVMLAGMLAALSARGDYGRIKSPDGEHCLIRKETDVLLGQTKYYFYIKDSGVVYRYIFESTDPEPELEWTSSGVKYQGELYKY